MEDVAKQPVKEPEVSIALDEQQKAIECLSEISQHVWDKFQKVVRSGPPEPEDRAKKTESTVPLVIDLKQKTGKIQDITDQLRQLLSLCEL